MKKDGVFQSFTVRGNVQMNSKNKTSDGIQPARKNLFLSWNLFNPENRLLA